MNLSDEDNTTFQPFDVNVTTGQPQYDYDYDDENDAAMHTARIAIIAYVCPALGIPGNILSAIIWLRRHVASKNSSAVYLSALAINDLVYLICFNISDYIIIYVGYWLYYYNYALLETTAILEPLLVLGFSVERLIAISCPLQVRLCNYIFDIICKITEVYTHGEMH